MTYKRKTSNSIVLFSYSRADVRYARSKRPILQAPVRVPGATPAWPWGITAHRPDPIPRVGACCLGATPGAFSAPHIPQPISAHTHTRARARTRTRTHAHTHARTHTHTHHWRRDGTRGHWAASSVATAYILVGRHRIYTRRSPRRLPLLPDALHARQANARLSHNARPNPNARPNHDARLSPMLAPIMMLASAQCSPQL